MYGLAGGMLIGLSAVVLMLTVGRIAGVSGIVGGLLPPTRGDVAWRVVFVFGLWVGAMFMGYIFPTHLAAPYGTGLYMLGAAFLVGFGATYGSGCTSGHGVCGLARLSGRSMVAVAVFMASAILTVGVIRHGL